MNTTSLRDQLQTLSIDRKQRPSAAPRRKSRAGLIFLILVAGLGGGAYAARDRLAPLWESASNTLQQSPAADLKLLTVTETREQPDAGAALTASGKMVSDHQVEVATKVSGQIIELHFEQGDYVKQGQLLARIEDKIYHALRDQAAANEARARAARAYQEINWDRVHTADHMWSDIELADAKRALEEARAIEDAAHAALRFAQKQLDDCEVLAPIAGVVLERNVEVGDFVAAEGGRGANANAQFAAIADMTKLRVEVDVSELDIARLRTGMPCSVVPDAYKDRKYDGHIMWIDPGANYAKATVQVKVRIDNPDEYLRVEGSAQVQFLREATTSAPTSSAAPRIWIPSACVQTEGGGKATSVFVVQDGRLRKTAIRTGEKRGDQVEVLEGLRPGQQIARGDLSKLAEGQRVKQ